MRDGTGTNPLGARFTHVLATECTYLSDPDTAIVGGPGGTRTHDPKIKSPVLYQLSYRPTAPPS